MSDRRTQAAMLAAVGAMVLWLGLTDAALAYVRGTLRPSLAASGVVLLVLAGAALRGHEPTPGGHGHDHGAPRSGWLLALPVLVLLLVAPPALGSFAASRQGAPATQAGDATGVFPPLPGPVGGAVPLAVSE
ncbi:MAG TPA: TIGR03943 family protein, partial [Actinomycetota bacterium]|nr:TIGR03943 family protein [Actinomycetota bacterium]